MDQNAGFSGWMEFLGRLLSDTEENLHEYDDVHVAEGHRGMRYAIRREVSDD